jgi:hypothetical protein
VGQAQLPSDVSDTNQVFRLINHPPASSAKTTPTL